MILTITAVLAALFLGGFILFTYLGDKGRGSPDERLGYAFPAIACAFLCAIFVVIFIIVAVLD